MSDPARVNEGPSIRHMVGNIGKPGITLLVPPPNLLIKPPDQDFRTVRHNRYYLKRVDSFSGTFLHLSFTNWIAPLNGSKHGVIDQDVFLVEAVVSIRNSGRWIADIDVINKDLGESIAKTQCGCTDRSATNLAIYRLLGGAIGSAIDSWRR